MLLGLIERDGLTPKRKTGNEYASPCPACGGRDRFVIHTDTGRYWCRGCNKGGDALQYLRDFIMRDGIIEFWFTEHGVAIRQTARPINNNLDGRL
jgi:phage/plasmid primase-like uncharacterized protein